MSIKRLVLVVCIVIFCSFPFRLSAQNEIPNSSSEKPNTKLQSYDQWAVRCETGPSAETKSCSLFQRLTLQSGQQFLVFQVLKTESEQEDSQQYQVIFTLPLGVYLPAGMTIQINDGEILPLQYERCDHNGCYAGMIASEEFIEACINGRTAKISFETLGGQAITTPMSLYGFTAGLEVLP